MKLYYLSEAELNHAFPEPEKLIQKLDQENRDRIGRKTGRGQLQSLAAHLLSLYAVQMMGRRELLPLRDAHGCPVLRQREGQPVGLYLSCTHTYGIAAAAVSDSPIGIDAERVRPWNPRLSRRMFDPAENSWIERHTEPDLAFTQIWTLRESYGKMLGTGILRMPRVGFRIGPDQAVCTDPACSAWTGMADGAVLSAVWRKRDGREEPEPCPVLAEDLIASVL